MRHVAQKVCADPVADLPEPVVIQKSRVSRISGDDQLGLEPDRQRFELVIVDQLGLGVEAVRQGLKVNLDKKISQSSAPSDKFYLPTIHKSLSIN